MRCILLGGALQVDLRRAGCMVVFVIQNIPDKVHADYDAGIGGEAAMNVNEETVEAMLEPNGQLRLLSPPQVPAGPVLVTIRVNPPTGRGRGLADVIGEIAAEQRARGFGGRSADDVRTEAEALLAEDAERDAKLDAARRGNPPGKP